MFGLLLLALLLVIGWRFGVDSREHGDSPGHDW